MKMSDEIGFEVGVIEAGKNAYLLDENDIAFAEFESVREAKAAAHAINMHDKLVNLLEELLAQAKKLDNIIDMCSGTWAQSEVTNEQDLFSALVSSAETLLTQAKGE